MRVEFKYRLGHDAKASTAVFLSVMCAVTLWTMVFVDGTYMFACMAVISLSTLGIGVLTRPRRVIVTDDTISIRSISTIRSFRRSDIRQTERIPNLRSEVLVPLYTSMGLFGMYGAAFSLRHLRKTTILASRRSHLLRIRLSTGETLILGFDGDEEAEKYFQNGTLH